MKRMSNTLSVKVSSRKTATSSWYEGTVSINGLRPTKLARRADGSTQFPTKSALSGAARNLAKSLGYSDVEVNDGSKPAQKPQSKPQAPKNMLCTGPLITHDDHNVWLRLIIPLPEKWRAGVAVIANPGIVCTVWLQSNCVILFL